jgi:proline iminopeptidase
MTFYEGQQARNHGRLDLGHGYDLYFEESGNPDGVPVLYLHGGPGGGLTASARRFHDPQAYNLIMHDQRGAGLSRPCGGVKHNDTSLLIQDIEQLRTHLGIQKWIVSGGSWGVTLALAYAQAYPSRCSALVLRGVFLGTRDEMHWVNQGMRKLFPLEWLECVEGLSEAEQDHLHSTIRSRVFGPDQDVAVRAAIALAKFEFIAATVSPDRDEIEAELTPEFSLQYSRIVCHYVMNDFFIDPDQLIREIGKIHGIPGYIVQGTCDWVCPPWSAVRLHRAWPGSRLMLLKGAGHSSSEPDVAEAIWATMEELKGLAS